jgi:hypothetical protein
LEVIVSRQWRIAVRRSPSLTGNVKCLPVRARRMAFWERPTPALADR